MCVTVCLSACDPWLKGSAIAHAIREFESEGAAAALQNALTDVMGDIGKLGEMSLVTEERDALKKVHRRQEDEIKVGNPSPPPRVLVHSHGALLKRADPHV